MSSNSKKQPALGRGLSALLQNSDTDITSMSGATVGSVSMIEIHLIEANPFNPRTHFEKDALEELRMSILTHGIIQPLTVRKLGRDRYQLISGERRFRASQLAGLKEVPAYIRIANDQTMLEMALVENIQREDLNAIEVAISYERLIDECKLTQEQLSEKVAKSRSHIANHIRLLKLPASIQAGVRDQVITMGHARALLSISDENEQLIAYQQIIDDSLSVRAVEQLVKPTTSTAAPKAKTEKVGLNSSEQVFTSFLSDKLGAKVSIDKSETGKGKVVVHFSSETELNRVMALLKKIMSRLLLLFLFSSFSSWCQPLVLKDSLFPEYKKVMIYSAVLPGAGQVYNSIHREKGPKHAYWKVPLIYAALGASGYFLTVNNQTQKSLKTEYTNRMNNAGSLNPTWSPYDDQAVLSLYQSYLNKRDMSILGCAAVYFIQIAEAGVEAHFLHFDVSDKLSLQAAPIMFGPSSAGIHIKLQFR